MQDFGGSLKKSVGVSEHIRASVLARAYTEILSWSETQMNKEKPAICDFNEQTELAVEIMPSFTEDTMSRPPNSTKSPDPLSLIIQKLDRGLSPDNKWPDDRGEYWALCPFHNDTQTGNFFVGDKGYKCFSCGESGGLSKLAITLGIDPPQLSYQGLTLNDYANQKQLPRQFLENLGIKEGNRNGKPILQIPYSDENGNEVAVRYRWTLHGDQRFTWKSNSKIIPYGVWRWKVLRCCTDKGGAQKEIILVEGEFDCHTLWFHNIDALGLPGATTWKSDWSKFLEGCDVYIWQEPDEGGGKFVETIGNDFPDAKVLVPPQNRKDVSECHIQGDDLPTLLQKMKSAAKTVREIQNEQTTVQASEVVKVAEPLLESQHILDDLVSLCREFGLVGEERNAKLIYLALTSRLLEKPINLILKGPSSGGKSFTPETVLKAFPDSAFYTLSSMSDHALVYFEEPMSHRHLIIFEASGLASELADYFIRSLLSEGRIRYLTVEKTNDGMKSREIELLGPTGLILTTTRVSLHPENETRMMSLSIKDDPQQTQDILLSLADRANGTQARKPDISQWHALQTWLELVGKREVTIPYAHSLAQHTDTSAIRMRRDFDTVLNYIRAHAILNQMHRKTDTQGRIIATTEDYRVVHDLIIDLISEGVGLTVSSTIRETVEAVRKISASKSNNEVSIRELQNILNLHKSTVTRRVHVAIEFGYLKNNEDRKGKPAKISPGDPLPDDTPVLPPPADLEKYFFEIPPENTATVQHLFSPSSEWQEIPPDVPVPPGGEFRMDLATGKNYGKWPDLGPTSTPTQPQHLNDDNRADQDVQLPGENDLYAGVI